jgi:hypothetical protein
VPQQAGHAHGGRGRRGQGKRIDDLGSAGRILGVETIEEGEHIAEEHIRGVDGKPSVKATEGAVVGGRREQWQTDKPARQEIGGQQPLQFGIAAGVGPGAHDFGADQLIDGEGGRGAFGALWMAVGCTGSDEGSRVIGLGDADERVVSAAGEDGAQEPGLDPGQDGLHKGAEHPEREWGQGGQVRKCHLPGA